MLNLRRLQHFVALSEEGAFSRAARRLHLTQPALTRSIKTLEDTLGLVLLERGHDGVRLTGAGQTILAMARRTLLDALAIQREADLIRGIEVGRVAFGVGVLPASLFLAEVLIRQVAMRPRLLVRVEVESWVRLQEKLQRDELDFAVAMTHSLPPPAGYRVLQLPTQRLGYFVRSIHPLVGKGLDEVKAALHQFPLLSPQMPSQALQDVAERFGMQSADEVPGLRCDNAQILKRIALATDAVLFSTCENLKTEIERGELVMLPPSNEKYRQMHISLIHAESRSLSPAAQWLVSLIQDSFPGAI